MAAKKMKLVEITISEKDRDALENAMRAHWDAERFHALQNMKAAMKDGDYSRVAEECANMQMLDSLADFYLGDLSNVDFIEPSESQET